LRAPDHRDGHGAASARSSLAEELAAHIPYSVFTATFAIILTGILTVLMLLVAPGKVTTTAGQLLHCFPPAAHAAQFATTSAMFWRHDRSFWKAVLIGVVGSIGVCGISDVMFPYLGGNLLGVHMHFHWCIIEHPLLVVPFVVVGVVTGIAAAEQIPRVTFFSHSSHVLVSSMASLLYLVSFGLTDWMNHLGAVLPLVVVAVLLPCCTSDIVFPLLFVSRRRTVPERGSATAG